MTDERNQRLVLMLAATPKIPNSTAVGKAVRGEQVAYCNVILNSELRSQRRFTPPYGHSTQLIGESAKQLVRRASGVSRMVSADGDTIRLTPDDRLSHDAFLVPIEKAPTLAVTNQILTMGIPLNKVNVY